MEPTDTEALETLEPLKAQEGLEAFTVVQKLEDLLLVSVPRDLTDDDVLRLRRQVLFDIRRFDSRWVLLDFSLVDICDSFFGRFIHSTAQMAQLMGADVIVSGLQDAVVETMIELGMTLPNIHAVLDLDDALALSREVKQAIAAEEADVFGLTPDQEASQPTDQPPEFDAFLGDAPLQDWEV
jgi:rsbT antagonist protein RsbS